MDLAIRRAAFTEALEPRLREIYSYFRRLGVDGPSAEDLAQETMIAAWRNLASLRDESKVKGWLYRIAFRLYLAHRREVGARLTLDVAIEVAGPAADDPGSDARLDSQVAAGALRALPEKYLHPLALVYWEGLSYHEAAKVLSLPLGTLAWRVHKAVSLIRRALTEKEGADETKSAGAEGCRAADSLNEGSDSSS